MKVGNETFDKLKKIKEFCVVMKDITCLHKKGMIETMNESDQMLSVKSDSLESEASDDNKRERKRRRTVEKFSYLF